MWPKNETTPVSTTIKHAIRARIIAGQRRWRWDLNPRKGCPFTRFRVLRTPVHRRPPAFMTSPNRRPTAAGERPRTGVNDQKLSCPNTPEGPPDRWVAGGGPRDPGPAPGGRHRPWPDGGIAQDEHPNAGWTKPGWRPRRCHQAITKSDCPAITKLAVRLQNVDSARVTGAPSGWAASRRSSGSGCSYLRLGRARRSG